MDFNALSDTSSLDQSEFVVNLSDLAPSLISQDNDQKNQKSMVSTQFQVVKEESEEEEEEDSKLFQLAILSDPKNKIVLTKTPEKEEAIPNAKMALITEITIRSQEKILKNRITNAFTTYYYSKSNNSTLSHTKESIKKNAYYSALVLLDIFSKFQRDKESKCLFYIFNKFTNILCGNYKQEKFLLINTREIPFLDNLQAMGVRQYPMVIDDTNQYMSLVRFQGMRLFWNWYMNQILDSAIPYQIVSNFRFTCCQEQFPMETFSSGKDVKGNKSFEVTFKGYLLKQNVESLREMEEKNIIKVTFKSHEKTESFEKVVRKGFELQRHQFAMEEEHQLLKESEPK